MDILESLKLLKGIGDNLQDDLLELIIQESQDRILSYLNLHRNNKLKEVPSELNYVVRDVSIKRFNRINSEGATKKSEEGSSFEWQNSYLDDYLFILDSYHDDEDSKAKHGKIKVW